jgi:hypothetical protein
VFAHRRLGAVQRAWVPFLSFQASRAGLFCDLSTGEFCPLRIPPSGMAAASPIYKSRKDSALPSVTPEKAPMPAYPGNGYPTICKLKEAKRGKHFLTFSTNWNLEPLFYWCGRQSQARFFYYFFGRWTEPRYHIAGGLEKTGLAGRFNTGSL